MGGPRFPFILWVPVPVKCRPWQCNETIFRARAQSAAISGHHDRLGPTVGLAVLAGRDICWRSSCSLAINRYYKGQGQSKYFIIFHSQLNTALMSLTSTFSTGYAPVTVITHLDMLKDEGDKETAFDMASWATGSSSERTYFIANYTHEKSEFSLDVERTALDILEHALISAERFIRIRKQREKNQMEREVAAGGNLFYRSL